MNTSVVSDVIYDQWAKELTQLQQEHPEIACRFKEIKVKEYTAFEYFPTVTDFAKFFSRMPGHPIHDLQ
jgi:NAD-dependent DNA ligase